MEFNNLLMLQCELFILMAIGVIAKKTHVIDDAGVKAMSNLSINVIMPANIFHSFMIEFNLQILQECGLLLICGIVIQLIYLIVNHTMYNRMDPDTRHVFQYCTAAPNAGQMGTAVSEGVWGSIGTLYTSIFMIPQRIMMWSVGVSYYAGGGADKKKFIQALMKQPCLIAIYLGLLEMILQIPIPEIPSKTISFLSNSNTAIIMLIIGAIVADFELKDVITWRVVEFCIIRLAIFPIVAIVVGKVMGLTGMAMGINVLMAGMPAGSTAVIYGRKYNGDYELAAKCVLISTLISMVSLPLWMLAVQSLPFI